jgi:hypothetical protein
MPNSVKHTKLYDICYFWRDRGRAPRWRRPGRCSTSSLPGLDGAPWTEMKLIYAELH